MCRETDSQTAAQKERQKGRQIDRQIDKQTGTSFVGKAKMDELVYQRLIECEERLNKTE